MAAISRNQMMGLNTNSIACWKNVLKRGNAWWTMSSAVTDGIISDSSIRLSASLARSLPYHNRFDCRHISQHVKSNGHRAFLVDTLALVLDLYGLCSC